MAGCMSTLVTVLYVKAPTEDKHDDTKDTFCENLHW
jgi:hypothetical protein